MFDVSIDEVVDENARTSTVKIMLMLSLVIERSSWFQRPGTCCCFGMMITGDGGNGVANLPALKFRTATCANRATVLA